MEPDPKTIEKLKKSFQALLVQEGNSVYKFIDVVAESMAYQYAVRKHYLTMYLEEVKETKKHKDRIKVLEREIMELRAYIRRG